MNYNKDISYYKKELTVTTDEKTKVKLKQKIKKIDQLQLELIQQYIEEYGQSLPIEMEVYFTGENLFSDENLQFLEWGKKYNKNGP